MLKTILSDDRQYRYNEAWKAMDVIMDPEYVGNTHIGNVHIGHVLRHLSAAGVSMGVFLREYFGQKFVPVKQQEVKVEEPTDVSFKCACNRMFKNKNALNGHKRTCKS